MHYKHKTLVALSFLLFLTSLNQVFAQGVNVTGIVNPTNADQWSICDEVGGLFTITTVSFSDTSENVVMTIDLHNQEWNM